GRSVLRQRSRRGRQRMDMASDVERLTTDPSSSYRDAERSLFVDLGLAGRERTVRLADGGARVRVVEIGEGPVALHVHGGGAFGALHAPLVAALPGRRHILLDRPGFGLSERAQVAPDFRGRSVRMLTSILDALELD